MVLFANSVEYCGKMHKKKVYFLYFKAPDEYRLSHVPYTSDCPDQKDIYGHDFEKTLLQCYEDGVHGLYDHGIQSGRAYLNDRMLYELLVILLRKYQVEKT